MYRPDDRYVLNSADGQSPVVLGSTRNRSTQCIDDVDFSIAKSDDPLRCLDETNLAVREVRNGNPSCPLIPAIACFTP
ncbi:hypothetical protein D3C85_1827750 [compost metagenome]